MRVPVFIKEIVICRASKRNFAMRNKTALQSRGQAATSLKIEDLRSNKTTGKLVQQIFQITYNLQGRSQNNGEIQAPGPDVSARGLRLLMGAIGQSSRKLTSYTTELSAFNNMKFRLFCPFLTIPLYGLTRTLTSLTIQTDLSRPDRWSCYCIPFETLMPKAITKYMSDRGYLLNFYSS